MPKWLRRRGRSRLAEERLEQLEALRARMVQVEAVLQEHAAAEDLLRRRTQQAEAELADALLRLEELGRQRVVVEEELGRERERADLAEARTGAEAEALAECQRLLAEHAVAEEHLRAELEQERALRLRAEHEAEEAAKRQVEAESAGSFEERLAPLWSHLVAERELLDGLARRLEQVVSRLHPPLRLMPPPDAPSEHVEADTPDIGPPARQYLCFFSTGKQHELIELEGPLPSVGAVIDLGAYGHAQVVKLARSPLPNDARRCVYVLPVSEPPADAADQHSTSSVA